MPSNDETQQGTAYRANGDNGDDGETQGELNQWKYRAPYRVHDNDKNFHVRYRAQCHCGKVKYQLSREQPLDAKYCHCLTCQRLHGAPFQWSAIFHKTDINFTHGHHELGWYESSERTCVHKLPCKVSCAYCRTPIMDEGRNMILLFPTLIDFQSEEDRRNFEPTCHMFYGRRVLDVNDGKPKWAGINGDSERMKETELYGGDGGQGRAAKGELKGDSIIKEDGDQKDEKSRRAGDHDQDGAERSKKRRAE